MAGSAGEQPAEEYPAETHSDEKPGQESCLPWLLNVLSHRNRFPDALENSSSLASILMPLSHTLAAARTQLAIGKPALSEAALDCKLVR